MKVAIGTGLGFFTLVTPLLIHFLTKRYVTWMYYDPRTEKFTASTWSFFVREKIHKFTADEVEHPDFGGFLMTVKVEGKPLFIIAEGFLSKEAYIKLMGYDKPIDWSMPDDDDDKKKSEQK